MVEDNVWSSQEEEDGRWEGEVRMREGGGVDCESDFSP